MLKKKLIFYIVLTFLISSNYGKEQKLLTKYGLYFSKENKRVFFYSHKVTTKWTLSLKNPTNLFSYDDIRYSGPICISREARYKSTYEKVSKTINEIWVNEIDKVTHLANSNNTARTKRSGTLVVLGITALISAFLTYAVTTHFSTQLKEDVYKVENNQAQMASVLGNTLKNTADFRNMVCHYYEHENENYVEQYLHEYIKSFETTIFKFISGSTPPLYEHYNSLFRMCIKSQNIGKENADLVNIFCKEFIKSSIEIDFQGITLDSEQNILILNALQIPILATDVLTHNPPSIIKAISVGFYSNKTKFEIDVPENIVLFDQRPIYELAKGECNTNVCPLTSLKISQRANCINNIWANRSIKGCNINKINDPVCNCKRIDNQYMLSVSKGQLINSRWSVSTREVTQENLVLRQGQLYCYSSSLNFTIHLPALVNYTEDFKPINEIEINETFNFEKFIPEKVDLPHMYFSSEKAKTHHFIYWLLAIQSLIILFITKKRIRKFIRYIRSLKDPNNENKGIRKNDKNKAIKFDVKQNKNEEAILRSGPRDYVPRLSMLLDPNADSHSREQHELKV